MRPETKDKLEALAESDDPETRRIAQDALRGIRYNLDELERGLDRRRQWRRGWLADDG